MLSLFFSPVGCSYDVFLWLLVVAFCLTPVELCEFMDHTSLVHVHGSEGMATEWLLGLQQTTVQYVLFIQYLFG